jgi:hypothetical protein
MSDRQRFFQSVYHNNLWGSGESRSGQGSELVYTSALRAELPGLLKQLEVHSIWTCPAAISTGCSTWIWPAYSTSALTSFPR